MGFSKNKTLTTRKLSLTKKLAFGFIGASAATIIGTAGIAAAQTSQGAGQMPTNMSECDQWSNFHFKNHGQCVSWLAHHRHGYGGDHDGDGDDHGHGHGYGNNNNVSTTVNIDPSGNNNFIEVAINYLF